MGLKQGPDYMSYIASINMIINELFVFMFCVNI